MTDSAIERARAGDEKAWGELVSDHLGTVYAICRALGLDGNTAGEVNQAVWLRLVEHLPRIRTPTAVGAWIAATTRRECLHPSRAAQRSGWITGGLSVRLDDGADPIQIVDGVTLSRSFARVGATCQRLLRLLAVQPSPSDDVIGTALDMPVEDVPAACRTCRARLERVVWSDATDGRRHDLSQTFEQVIASCDPVPAPWWEAAEAAFGWLCIDAVTADVVYDSMVTKGSREDGYVPRGARRCLRFSAGPRQVDVVIDVTTGRREDPGVLLTGRVAPTLPDHVGSAGEPGIVARWPGGSAPAPLGPDGKFLLRGLPLAPLSVEVGARGPVTSALKTGWIFL